MLIGGRLGSSMFVNDKISFSLYGAYFMFEPFHESEGLIHLCHPLTLARFFAARPMASFSFGLRRLQWDLRWSHIIISSPRPILVYQWSPMSPATVCQPFSKIFSKPIGHLKVEIFSRTQGHMTFNPGKKHVGLGPSAGS